MKILLVNPPWTFHKGTNRRPGGPPSTLAVVAAALQPWAEVEVWDAMATDESWTDGTVLEWGQLGGAGNLWLYVAANQIDAVGFSSTWTVQHPHVTLLAEHIKGHTNAKTFCGGHHVTVEGITQPYMDLTVVGEVESCAQELVTALEHGNGGLIYGRPVQDLDSFPFPAYELLDLEYYRKAQRNHHGSSLLGGMPVTTSRGCPHRCNFCTVHLSMGRAWRANTPGYVIRHLMKLHELGFDKIHFEDDNLLLDKMRWIAVMRKMAQLDLWQWDTPNGVRLDALTDDVLELAEASGCRELRVSIESASDHVRNDLMHKRLNIGNIEHVAEVCARLGVRLSCFYTVGIPGETVENIRATLRLAAHLEDDCGVVPRFSIATPFAKTELLEDCIKNGWLDVPYPFTPEQLAGGTHLRGLIRTPEFGPEDISKAYEDWKARIL